MLDRFEDIRGSGRAGKFDRLDRFNRRLAGSRKARLGFQVSTSISRDAYTRTHARARTGITYERNRGEIRRCRGNNRQERGEEGWLAKNGRLVNSFRASAARISRSV